MACSTRRDAGCHGGPDADSATGAPAQFPHTGHLVSVETETGWYHDVWYPGYAWADTPRSWRPVGLNAQGDSNTYFLDHPALADAVVGLARLERASGQWTLARCLTPFSTLVGRGFPVVLSFLADDAPATSSLAPALVAERLAKVDWG